MQRVPAGVPDFAASPRRHPFDLDPRFGAALLPFGVCDPTDAHVDLDDDGLRVRFGHFSLVTPVRNLAGAQVTGPFRAAKALGARLSLADRGVTFGSATERGACIRFHRPVPALDPLGALRHPGVTVTVAEPERLVDAVEHYAGRTRLTTARRSEPTPQPGPVARAGAVLRYPAGLALTATRYLRRLPHVDRAEDTGDASDLPPALPEEFVDAHLKTVGEGSGPLLHRVFTVDVRDSGLDAAALMDRVCADLDRAAPSEVVTFRKQRGRLGEVAVGDEYVVHMPAPWNGPVRVVHRDATSFRFATLAGHLEAGQIEFSAHDTGRGVAFRIETWSRPGDRPSALVFDVLRVGKEIQLHMWTHFCLRAGDLSGGRVTDGVRVRTRRASWPPRVGGGTGVRAGEATTG
ncbi:hypothetical protein GCM10009772_11990 [Pseudonocardia alni subsp. carboxydivorans]|uniref:DUF1990 family protein n=1 Tax=Pseudonocardia alni subsp. carboxydivorans TaxID=415010 RepID=A0ABU9AJX6_PSEA5